MLFTIVETILGAQLLAHFSRVYLCYSLLSSNFVIGSHQWKILKNQPLGCLVVVVGNLTVGGTGKTPVVEIFARNLAQRGRKVAILSRGYKSRKEPAWRRFWRLISHQEEPPPKIVSDGANVLLDSEQAGDEPYMLACNLPVSLFYVIPIASKGFLLSSTLGCRYPCPR